MTIRSFDQAEATIDRLRGAVMEAHLNGDRADADGLAEVADLDQSSGGQALVSTSENHEKVVEAMAST